jgi:hypothetical protein
MTTRLDTPLRREITIDDKPHTLTIDPDGLKLVEKGRRKGVELTWAALVSGDTALASALQASLELRPRRTQSAGSALASAPRKR